MAKKKTASKKNQKKKIKLISELVNEITPVVQEIIDEKNKQDADEIKNLEESKKKKIKNDKKKSDLSRILLDSISPVTKSVGGVANKAFSMVKTQAMSEIPELGMFSGMISDFMSMLKTKSKEPESEKTKKNIKIIKDESETQTNVMDILSIEMADIGSTLETLLGVTSKVWDVEHNQLEELQKQAAENREKRKKEKFEKQKSESKISPKSIIPDITPKNSKSFWEKILLLPLLRMLGPLLTPIMTAGAAIFGMKKMLGFGVNGVSATGGTASKFGKVLGPIGKMLGIGAVASGVAKVGGTASKFGKVLGPIGKGIGIAGRLSGKLLWPLSAAMAVGGAIQGGYDEYKQGGDYKDILLGALKGAVMSFIQPFLDLGALIKDMISPYIKQIKTWVVDVFGFAKDKVIEGFKFVKESIIKIKDDYIWFITDYIPTVLEDLKTSFMDWVWTQQKKIEFWFTNLGLIFEAGLKNILKKIVPEKNTISVLGTEIKYVPDTIHDYVWGTNKDIQPDSQATTTAMDIRDNQREILNKEAEIKFANSKGLVTPNISNIAPVTNTTIVSGVPMNTRNPDGPLYMNVGQINP